MYKKPLTTQYPNIVTPQKCKCSPHQHKYSHPYTWNHIANPTFNPYPPHPKPNKNRLATINTNNISGKDNIQRYLHKLIQGSCLTNNPSPSTTITTYNGLQSNNTLPKELNSYPKQHCNKFPKSQIPPAKAHQQYCTYSLSQQTWHSIRVKGTRNKPTPETHPQCKLARHAETLAVYGPCTYKHRIPYYHKLQHNNVIPKTPINAQDLMVHTVPDTRQTQASPYNQPSCTNIVSKPSIDKTTHNQEQKVVGNNTATSFTQNTLALAHLKQVQPPVKVPETIPQAGTSHNQNMKDLRLIMPVASLYSPKPTVKSSLYYKTLQHAEYPRQVSPHKTHATQRPSIVVKPLSSEVSEKLAPHKPANHSKPALRNPLTTSISKTRNPSTKQPLNRKLTSLSQNKTNRQTNSKSPPQTPSNNVSSMQTKLDIAHTETTTNHACKAEIRAKIHIYSPHIS
eukprot:gene2538-1593_t